MALYRQCASALKIIISQQIAPIYRQELRSIKRWVAPTFRELKRRKDRLTEQNSLKNQPAEIPRSSYLDWNYNAEIYAFQKRLNEEFDSDLLRTALTNRSYVIKEEARQKEAGIAPDLSLGDNSALVHEGEAFILKCVREELKKFVPKLPGDGIEAVCAGLTGNEALANVARFIGLKDITLCGEYPPEASTLSATFKAVVAALNLSSNASIAAKFIRDFVLLRQLSNRDINDFWHIEDPLKMLAELLKTKVEPRLCHQSATGTILAAFQVGLYADKKCVGLGWGETIDTGIEMAARDGLRRLFETTDSMPPLPDAIQSSEGLEENLNKRVQVRID